MSMKVFLVSVSFEVPVVAEDEESAINRLIHDTESMAVEALEQQLLHLADGDDADMQLDSRELRAEDILGPDADWGDAVPFGDDSEATIAERLLDDANENEPPQDVLWGEPDHVDD